MNTFRAARRVVVPRRRQGGLAVVEFAISMGVILLLMLGTAEIGRVWFSYNTLNKSVRTGARYLSDKVMSGAGVVALSDTESDRTKNMVVHHDLNGSRPTVLPEFATGDVTVTLQDANVPNLQYVRVRAAYDYTPMINSIPNFGFGEPIDLAFTMTAASSMRVLR